MSNRDQRGAKRLGRSRSPFKRKASIILHDRRAPVNELEEGLEEYDEGQSEGREQVYPSPQRRPQTTHGHA